MVHSLNQVNQSRDEAEAKARNRGINPMQSKFAESVSSAISDFSQSFSLRASILKSVVAVQWLLPCRDHCPQSVEHLTAVGKTASRSAARGRPQP